MRFSLFYNGDVLPDQPIPALYADIEAQAVLADQLGFATIWLAEHHFDLYGKVPSPLLLLARISALTQQIGLGTAVVEAPYYHPLRLAEDTALLDVLSGGRVRLGIGSGARNKPDEFVPFGIPIEEKTVRTREIVTILHQALATGRVHFAGEHYRYEQVAINPRPIQTVESLLCLAASSSTPEIAGQHGYGLLVPRVGAAAAHQGLIERYRVALHEKSGSVALLRFVFVAPTEREAQAQTQRTVERYAMYECGVRWDRRTDTAEYHDLLARMNMAIGTPEQITEQIMAWQTEFGCDELICQTYAAGIDHADALRSIELLGRTMLPQFVQDRNAAE